jgi:hypothetical protein
MFESARQRAGLTPVALWWAYFALGGNATPIKFAAFLNGEIHPARRDHDLLSQALNDRFIEMGMDSPLPSFDEWHSGQSR